MMSRWSKNYWPVKQTPLFPSLAGQSPFLNLTIWNTLRTETWKITFCIQFLWSLLIPRSTFSLLHFSCLDDPGSARLVAASFSDASSACNSVGWISTDEQWACILVFELLWKQLYCEQTCSILNFCGVLYNCGILHHCGVGLSELGVELLPVPLPCGEEGPIGRAGLPFLKESKLWIVCKTSYNLFQLFTVAVRHASA